MESLPVHRRLAEGIQSLPRLTRAMALVAMAALAACKASPPGQQSSADLGVADGGQIDRALQLSKKNLCNPPPWEESDAGHEARIIKCMIIEALNKEDWENDWYEGGKGEAFMGLHPDRVLAVITERLKTIDGKVAAAEQKDTLDEGKRGRAEEAKRDLAKMAKDTLEKIAVSDSEAFKDVPRTVLAGAFMQNIGKVAKGEQASLIKHFSSNYPEYVLGHLVQVAENFPAETWPVTISAAVQKCPRLSRQRNIRVQWEAMLAQDKDNLGFLAQMKTLADSAGPNADAACSRFPFGPQYLLNPK